MPGERERILESLGYPLERLPGIAAIYKAVVVDGTTAHTSGNLPFDGDVLIGKGKLPTEVSIEEGKRHAALCAANVLRHVIRHIGSLDRIERVLRTVGYVNSEPAFTGPHLVLNGASELLRDVFGPDHGIGVRAAVGVAALPLGSSVEVDITFRLKG